MILTNSRVTTYRKCPKLHHYSYNLGYRPVSVPYPMRFGDVTHIGLQFWWEDSGTERLEAALSAVSRACDDEEFDDFERVKVEELLRGYHYRWIDTQDSILTIAAEKEFHLPLMRPDGYVTTLGLSGKMDALAELPGRGIYVVEHKTSTADISPGSSYWRALNLDSQISTYDRAARQMNIQVSGTLYDVLARPTMKPAKETANKKYRKTDGKLYANMRERDETPEEFRSRLRADIAENPDAYYQRGFIVRTESDRQKAEQDLWQTAQLMLYSLENDCHPRNPKACLERGSECSFLGVCEETESLDDPLKFRKSESEHEELKGTKHDQESIQASA